MKSCIEPKPTGSSEAAQTNQQTAGIAQPNKQGARRLAPTEVAVPLDNGESSEARIAYLLSRRQLADRWGCCPHTIARRKDLKPVRFNKRFLRYRLADIEAIEAAAVA